jgi:hypothetical protein
LQTSVVMMVDVEAVLAQQTVEDNVYLVDNIGSLGLLNKSAQNVTTNIAGALNYDGSQATEGVMNWIGYGIAAAPPTLPKSVVQLDQATARFQRLLADVKSSNGRADVAKLVARHEDPANLPPAAHVIESKDGRIHPMPFTFPRLAAKVATGEAATAENDVTPSDLSPVITGIAGPAVDNGVLYPAQYGSPDFYTEGWYWSATVDLQKAGLHEYHINFVVYRPTPKRAGTVVWKPEPYVLKANVNVYSGYVTNGFTGYGPGVLPLIPA